MHEKSSTVTVNELTSAATMMTRNCSSKRKKNPEWKFFLNFYISGSQTGGRGPLGGNMDPGGP